MRQQRWVGEVVEHCFAARTFDRRAVGVSPARTNNATQPFRNFRLFRGSYRRLTQTPADSVSPQSPGSHHAAKHPPASPSVLPHSTGTTCGTSPRTPPRVHRSGQVVRRSVRTLSESNPVSHVESVDQSNRATPGTHVIPAADNLCSSIVVSTYSVERVCVSVPKPSAESTPPAAHAQSADQPDPVGSAVRTDHPHHREPKTVRPRAEPPLHSHPPQRPRPGEHHLRPFSPAGEKVAEGRMRVPHSHPQHPENPTPDPAHS